MYRSPVQIPTNYSGSTEMHRQYNTGVTIPPVAPTPGPRTIQAIQNDARARFAGVLFIQKDASRTIEDYFIEYDFWEPYSETKSYSKRPYQAAYKGIMRDYHNYLCILNTDASPSEEGEQVPIEEYYVVAKRIRNELETLELYCLCTTCSAFVLNPLKYLWCPHCTKCIKAGAGFAKEEYIIKARELKQAKEQSKHSPSKYGKYIEGTRWIKATEIVVVLVVTLGFIYSYFL